MIIVQKPGGLGNWLKNIVHGLIVADEIKDRIEFQGVDNNLFSVDLNNFRFENSVEKKNYLRGWSLGSNISWDVNDCLINNQIKMDQNCCNICADTITAKRRIINCEYCHFEACVECYQKYLVTIDAPGCMNSQCTGEWSRKFINNNFPATYINKTLKSHKQHVLFQQELSLMPQTQMKIEQNNNVKRLFKERRILNNKIRDTYDIEPKLDSNPIIIEAREKYNQLFFNNMRLITCKK